MLMECTPSLVSWQIVNKLKRPGMNMLSAMQAVAHGAESVLHFKWCTSRGGLEKFHGAVVDHSGSSENTRVFNDVREVGRPALTENIYGQGKAYYIAARCEDSFHDVFYSKLIDNCGIKPALNTALLAGVTAQLRTDGKTEYVFVLNYNEEVKEIILDNENYEDMIQEKKSTER